MSDKEILDVCLSVADGRHVITVRGSLCLANSRLLSAPVQRLISHAEARRIDIDCSGVTRVDRASMRLLRVLRERGRAGSHRVAIVNPSAIFRVSRILELA